MKHALLGALSTLLLPFSAQAAATSAGGYLMRGGYQPRSYMRVDAAARASHSLQGMPGQRNIPKRQDSSIGNADMLTIHNAGNGVRELVIIDAQVPDKSAFSRDVRPGVDILELRADAPGLAQLKAALAGYHGLTALHIVSHAEQGALLLGNSRVDVKELKREMDAVASVRGAMADGADLLLYGCDLGAGDKGAEFLDILRAETGLNVAASIDQTGNAENGGNWELEVRRGNITTSAPFSSRSLRDFSEVLSPVTYGPAQLCPLYCGGDGPYTSGDGKLRFGASPWMYLDPGRGIHVTAFNGSGASRTFEVAAVTAVLPSFRLKGIRLESTCSALEVVGNTVYGSTVSASIAAGSGYRQTSALDVPLRSFRLTATGCPADYAGPLLISQVVIDPDVSPVVTDAKISIAGASGTGGAYKIGDSVVATWNNTASGDNSSGITGVTMDFSQFGGGSVVAASNSNNTWTAAYTITAGSIDATGRNISVTATNGNGSTTTADTTNAIVDNIAPTVTDAAISISGATGTSGAYKIGDTVTASWNNTGGGDNNADTIFNVTVDFSQFGGGAAVAATNSAGIWRATYMIVSGSVDATNRNVSMTATDNAGNAKTTADTTNARVDNNPPAVSSIVVSGSPASTDTSIPFTVTFDEAVMNISTDDFNLVRTGTATGTIASVSASSGSSINVNITGISGSGTIKVDLNGSTNIVDGAGNSIPSYSSGSTHTVAIPTAPGAPTIGTATAGDTQATLTFTAPGSNGGSAITSYTATASPGGAFGSCAGPAACTATITGLTNGTAYTFNVTATNAIGTGNASGASNSVTPKANQVITFAQPTSYNFGIAPTLTASSAFLLGGAATGFAIVFTSSTTGVCTITSGGELTFVSAGTCTVDADQAGNSSTNAASTVTRSFTVNASTPDAPTIGMATAGDQQATVTFTAPASTGGAAISPNGYTVTANPGGITEVGSSSPITVTGLTNGVAYTFTVTASNSAGTGAASSSSNSVLPASPQIITFSNPGSQNFGTTPTLTASSDSSLTVAFTSSTTGVCTIDGSGRLAFLSAGSCTINANQAGDSSYLAATQVSQTFTVNAVVPAAPTSVFVTSGDNQASVAFMAPISTGGATIAGYTVTVSPADVAPVDGAGSPIVVSGLTNGQPYTFTVTANNSAGTGPASSASNSATPAATQTITFNDPGARNFGTTPTLSATSDSGLNPTFTSSTTGVCTITSGGALTFLTAGICTINADQAGNGSYLAATQVSRSFTVNAVLPGAPVIGTAVAQGIDTAEINFTAPASTGGTAISSYTVTASPGGLTKTGSGSPITFNGLSPATTYTFMVAATNSVGTGSASASSNQISTIPLLQANDVSQNIGYGASPTSINLSITGSADEVLIMSQPTHGTATVSGTSISYQPQPGYAGPDQFTYAAKDAYSTSTPARVDITVTSPTLSMATSALQAARASTAYSQTLTASGGTGPYSYVVSSGSLPTGITLSAAGVLSGTPTQVGSFNVTITATDSSNGTGPFHVAQPYNLEVTAAQVELDLSVLPPASGDQDYTQALMARGGTAPYRFMVMSGQLPPGLSLAADGTLSGEPQAAGSYTFTLQVTDANGFTGTAPVTLKVDLSAQEITNIHTDPALPEFVKGGSFSASATGGGSGNPVQFSSGSPSVCSVSAAQVTMLAAGTCVLNADQAGNAMYQAAPQARLEVAIAAVTPTLQWMQPLSKIYGEAAFDLVDPRSDSQGAFTFSSSNTSVATVNGRTVTLVGAGAATLVATQQAQGSYTAATVEVELTVSARPDPTLDAEVRGGLQAQVDASVRFARVQLGNIQSRLQQVRSGENASSAALTLAYAGDLLGQGMSVPVKLPVNHFTGMPSGWGGWMSGTATFGNSGQQRGGSFDFNTDGISLGVDRSFGDNGLLGMAASLGRNRTRFDASPSRMDADQYSLAMYGLWRAGEHLFVDGVVAQGQLDFDIARWSSVAGTMALGQRDGSQTFGALTFGYQQQHGAYSLSGYGRFDGSRSRLDGYREHGLGVHDLTYAEQTVSNSGLAVGFDGSYSWQGERVSLRPFWKLEYRQSLSNTGDAWMNYVQQPSAGGYVLDMQAYADNMVTAAAGFDVKTNRGWLISLLFGRDQGSNSAASNSVGLRISYGSGGMGAGMMPGQVGESALDDCKGRRCRRPGGSQRGEAFP